MQLDRLAPGTRFRSVESPDLTGTLVKVGEGSATVELDGQPGERDFETADGERVKFKMSGKRRQTITKSLEVVPIRDSDAAKPQSNSNGESNVSTATQPASPSSPPPAQSTPAAGGPLWPRGIKIPFILATGEFGTGKSLFGVLIAVDSVCVFDTENSLETYEGSLGLAPCKTLAAFKAALAGTGSVRVDFPAMMSEAFKTPDYTSKQRFEVFMTLIALIPSGRFRVLMLDTASEVEAGLIETIKANPMRFGYTKNQLDTYTGMLQGAANDYWQQILSDLRVKCETFYATVHMRNEYKGNKPTGKREAKGRDTLMKLASLALEFDRRPDEKGKQPEKPNAKVMKSRLSVFLKNTETGELEPHPAVPPRMRDCSPARIRWYINNPPDYAKLKKEELAVEEGLTADEKLLLESQTQADRKDAATAELAKVELQANILRQRQATQATSPAAANPDQSGAMAQQKETAAVIAAATNQDAVKDGPRAADGSTQAAEQPQDVTGNGSAHSAEAKLPATADTSPHVSADSTASAQPAALTMITGEQKKALGQLKKDCSFDDDGWRKLIQKHFKMDSAKGLTEKQAAALIRALEKKRAEQDSFVDRVATGDGPAAAASATSATSAASTTNENGSAPTLDQWANQAAGVAPSPN